jgi:hypothetical protein
MAIGVMMEIPGGSQKMYDQIMKELDLKGRLPEGATCHFAGPVEGGWRVIDIWESKEAFERFMNARLRRAIERVAMPPAKPTFFSIHNSIMAHETVKH